MRTRLDRFTKYLIFDRNWRVKDVWCLYSICFMGAIALLLMLISAASAILFAAILSALAGIFIGLIAMFASFWSVKDYLED